MRRHPTAEELTTWMHGGPDDDIGTHLDHCPQCADVCGELAGDAGALAAVMSDSLATDPELEDRVMSKVENSLVARAAAESFLGLIGLGIEAARTILGEEQS